MSETDEKELSYEAVNSPVEARERDAIEILPVGMMSDERFVAARPAVDDPGMWREVLAEMAQAASPGSMRPRANTPTTMRWLRSRARSRPTSARGSREKRPATRTNAKSRAKPCAKASVY